MRITFYINLKLFVEKSHQKSIRSSVKIVENDIAHWGLPGSLHFSLLSLTERHGHTGTWICQTQIKPNWAWKTRTTIQKYIQWLRKGQRVGLVTHGLWYWNIFRILAAQRWIRKAPLCPALCSVSQFNTSVKWKSHFLNSALSIPQKKINVTELLFNACSRYIESPENSRLFKEIKESPWA